MENDCLESNNNSVSYKKDPVITVLQDNLIKAVNTSRADVLKSVIMSKPELIQGNKLILNSLKLSSGNSLLHVACQNESPDVVRILLQADADPTLINDKDQQPFQISDNPLIKQCFIHGAVEAICANNATRLHQFLSGGVDVNARDSESTRNTLLHWAASYANLDIIMALLDRSADVNAVNYQGVTPLHEAVVRKDLAIAEEFINYGADHLLAATSGRYAGKTALDLARPYAPLCSLMENPGEFALNSRPKTPAGDLMDPSLIPDISLNGDRRGDDDDSDDSEATEATRISVQTERSWITPCGSLSAPDIDLISSVWPPIQSCSSLSRSPNRRFYAPSSISIHLYLGSCQEKVEAEGVLSNLVDDLSKDTFEVESRVFLNQFVLPGATICLELGHSVARGRQDAYVVLVEANMIHVRAKDIQGLHLGCTTLLQLLQFGKDSGLPLIKIIDWPSVRERGILLDLSSEPHPKMEILNSWIVSWSHLKCNQIHFFFRYSHQRKSTIPSKRYYSLDSLKFLLNTCTKRRMKPVLALDIDQHVVSLDELQENIFINELMACFPSKSPIHIGPRISAHLVNSTSVPSNSSSNGTRSPSSCDLQLTDFTSLFTGDREVLMCAASLHKALEQHKVLTRTKVRRSVSSLSSDTSSICSGDTGGRDGDEEEVFTPPGLHSIPTLMHYVLMFNDDSTQKQIKYCDQFGLPYWICPASTNWTSTSIPSSISGCLMHQISQERLLLAPLSQPESSVVGLLSAHWSSSNVGHSLVHPLFAWPIHIYHLGVAWNPTNLIVRKASEHHLKKRIALILDRYVGEEGLSIGNCIIDFGLMEKKLVIVNKGVESSRLLTVSADLSLPIQYTSMEMAKITGVFNEARSLMRNIRDSSQVSKLSRLISFYLCFVQFTCRMIHLMNKFGAESKEKSVSGAKKNSLQNALLTDMANRLLVLVEQSQGISREWFEPGPGIDRSAECLRAIISQLVPDSESKALLNV